MEESKGSPRGMGRVLRSGIPRECSLRTETRGCQPQKENEAGARKKGRGQDGQQTSVHLSRPQPAGYRFELLSLDYVTPERGSWVSKGRGEGKKREEAGPG